MPGASDLSSIRYYTNEFDTTTQGIDLVGTYVTDWGNAGITNWSLAWNWTETEVDRVGDFISRNRVLELENYNPENRVDLAGNIDLIANDLLINQEDLEERPIEQDF